MRQHQDSNDQPDEPVIIREKPIPPKRRKSRLPLLFVLLFVGFLIMQNAVPIYTDWLWFGEVGYRQVFSTTIAAKTSLFVLFGAIFFVIFYGNIKIARRMGPEGSERMISEQFGAEWGVLIQRGIGAVLFWVSVFLSLWAGRFAAEEWTHWLTFTHSTPFNLTDPMFNRDISFYIFRLPFLSFVANFLMTTLLLTGAAVFALHMLHRTLESLQGKKEWSPSVRGQMLILLGAIALVHAVRTQFNAFGLLVKENGQFTGAGYADATYRLFAYNAQTVLLLLVGAACLLALFGKRDFKLPAVGAALWVGAVVLLGGALPGAVQKVTVEPNQIETERPFIERNITYTQKGYGLDRVKRIDNFPADESLTAQGLNANSQTLNNVRLWDYPYLGKVYNQLQTVKTYYRFDQSNLTGTDTTNIDVDRYTFGDRYQQVMLGAREMSPANLPRSAQTWQNRRTGYTHGYGIVMSPVNKVRDGEPEYLVQGFPPMASSDAPGLKITRPEIYFGLLSSDYVFVDTTQKEFDYPATDDVGGGSTDHYTNYEGKGGIRIGDASLSKLAFSLRLGDTNVLLAKGFKPSTRVLIRRDVRERVMTVAPFLQLDSDPYLVVSKSGRLVWMLDAYTISDRFPYSTRTEIGVGQRSFIAPNYIRNSVKATVDAYDGTIALYLADPNDPIAQTYAKIFPGMLKPLSELGDGLQEHIRYPEDLFRLQRSMYAVYHVTDPRTFYLREDVWAVPVEPNPSTEADDRKQMEPYYVIMHLPEEKRGKTGADGEFLLISPLAPINREDKNILGWMCARCDAPNYGELRLYRFPQKAAVNGPSQVISLLNSEPTISKELSLLRQSGSSARFGNVLALPIEKSLLYIAPLYIEATNSANIPQLQRVVVAFGQRVVMEPTLEEALARLFPGYGGKTTPTNETPTEPIPSKPLPIGTVSAPLKSLIDRASSQYDAAQQKLKAGDFAGYGAATKELERTLRDLKQAAGR
jgi:uncharacterized protein